MPHVSNQHDLSVSLFVWERLFVLDCLFTLEDLFMLGALIMLDCLLVLNFLLKGRLVLEGMFVHAGPCLALLHFWVGAWTDIFVLSAKVADICDVEAFCCGP